MSSWTKFKLLLWKNYVLQKRKPVVTAFEIGASALFALILIAIRQRVIIISLFKCHNPVARRGATVKVDYIRIFFFFFIFLHILVSGPAAEGFLWKFSVPKMFMLILVVFLLRNMRHSGDGKLPQEVPSRRTTGNDSTVDIELFTSW